MHRLDVRKSITPGGDSLQLGATTSGGESGGSPTTVLHMQMGDGYTGDTRSLKREGMIPTSTQTDKPTSDDKETMMTQDEVEKMETTETECRETQV